MKTGLKKVWLELKKNKQAVVWSHL